MLYAWPSLIDSRPRIMFCNAMQTALLASSSMQRCCVELGEEARVIRVQSVLFGPETCFPIKFRSRKICQLQFDGVVLWMVMGEQHGLAVQ